MKTKKLSHHKSDLRFYVAHIIVSLQEFTDLLKEQDMQDPSLLSLQVAWSTVQVIAELGQAVKGHWNEGGKIDWTKAFEKLIDLFTFFQQPSPAAPIGKAKSSTEPPAQFNLSAWLSAIDPRLAPLADKFHDDLGVLGPADMSQLDQKHFQDVGVKPAQMKPLLRAVEALVASGAAAAALGSRTSDVAVSDTVVEPATHHSCCFSGCKKHKPCPDNPAHLGALLKSLIAAASESSGTDVFLDNFGYLLDVFALPDEVKSIVEMIQQLFVMIKPVSVSVSSLRASISTASVGSESVTLARAGPAGSGTVDDLKRLNKRLNDALTLFSATFRFDVELVRALIGLAQMIVAKDSGNMTQCLTNLVGFAQRFGNIPVDKVEALMVVIQFVQDTSPRSVLSKLTAFVTKGDDEEAGGNTTTDEKSIVPKSAAAEKQDLGLLFDRFDRVRRPYLCGGWLPVGSVVEGERRRIITRSGAEGRGKKGRRKTQDDSSVQLLLMMKMPIVSDDEEESTWLLLLEIVVTCTVFIECCAPCRTTREPSGWKISKTH